jgi:nitroimidazol reductase NimA-like FMN-containing flavoprotein (pyridoxamine 5'-phosphate oxidase superfamily)
MVFQMPPLTQEEEGDLFVKTQIARLCSSNPDGTIHAAPIWFKYEEGQFVFGTQQDSRRVKNLKKNPNVTIVLDQDQPPPKGVVVYGRAVLDYDNVVDKRIRIFEKYMPTNMAENLARGLAKLRKPVIIRVTPSKTVSYDYGKDPTGLFKGVLF